MDTAVAQLASGTDTLVPPHPISPPDFENRVLFE